jgi:TatD DNase family protein
VNLKRIDAHSHVSFDAYREDADDVIRRALEGGTGLLAVGTRRETSESAVTCAEKYDGVWALVGLHPTHLFSTHLDEHEMAGGHGVEMFNADAYRALAKRPSKVVGIGECGLDYFRLPDNRDHEEIKSLQREAFRGQLDLAHELDLPVMIHCRDAHEETLAILDEYRAAGKPIRGNVHCFTGTRADAERYLALDFFISFTGIVTFPPRKSDLGKETTADVARFVPLEKMLIETDAPYLAPEPHRGERNEPAYVKHVAEFIAGLKGIATEKVERQTLENTRALFRLW